ncbi:integrase domain-containing protein [Paraburkholderia azotifigens]|uniref:integrase domain-containing protein n=1 Tax=Paraburkholderia azotifigens TaxID=2057004 RepID=UPI00317D61A8
MGKKSRLCHAAANYSKFRGGAYDTISNRSQLTRDLLFTFLARVNVMESMLRDIPLWAVAYYINVLLVEGMKPGHLHNTLSAIRVIFDEAGCGAVNTACSNAAMGVPRRNRAGKRQAVTDEQYHGMRERACAADVGLGHIVQLQRLLGLRSIEAFGCGPELPRWRDRLRSGAGKLHLSRVGKNGRPRDIEVLPAYREETIRVVEAAHAYCKERNFEFVTGRSGGRESSETRLRNLYRKAGIEGDECSHGLRYRYALDLALLLHHMGKDAYEVVLRTSNSLGHGGGARLVYIRTTYLSAIRDVLGPVRIPKEQSARAPRGVHSASGDTRRRMIRSNRSLQFKK